MAYKRHSQGGRFKRGEFGDLGLRAYTEARDREIRVAEEQRKQEQAYSQQHLQQIQGTGTKQIQHNRMLQDLTEDVGQLALNNTKLRGKREVEEILGRAKEAEKESQFWKDFSTTYAGQYAKAAGELYDFATEIQHQRQWDVIKNDPRVQKSLNDFGHLNEIEQKNLLVDTYKGLRDKGIPSEEARSMLIAQYSDLGLRMNHKTKMALANMILKKWAGQEALIREEMQKANDGAGIPLTRENIDEYYKLRGHELLQEYGISPTSIAGRHLLNGIFDKALDKGIEVNNLDIAHDHLNLHNRQKTQAINLISKIKYGKDKNGKIIATGDSVGNFVSGWNQMVIHYATMYKLDANGGVIEPKYGSRPNISLAHQTLGEQFIKAGYFNSWDQIENHLLNTPIPDEKDPYKPVQVGEETSISFKEKGAWGKKQPAHREVFLQAWKERKIKMAEEAAREQGVNDELSLLEIDERVKLDPSDDRYIDVKNPEHIQKALDTYSGNEKTTKMLRDFQIYNQFDKQATVVNQSLRALWIDGDLRNLSEYIKYIDDPKEKEIWIGRKEQLALLDRVGWNQQGLRDAESMFLNMIINDESIKKDLSLYVRTREDIRQEIIKQLDIIESNETESKLGDQAKRALIEKRIIEQMDLDSPGRKEGEDTIRGYGIFRRKGVKLKTRFLVHDQTETSEASLEQIKEQLKEKANWNTLFLQIKSKNGVVTLGKGSSEKSLRVISLDDADALIRAVDGGYPIPSNETIKWLAENQPTRLDNRPPLTEREITNLVLRGLGVRKEIPQGGREFADYVIKTGMSNIPPKEGNAVIDGQELNPEQPEISFIGIDRYSTANRVACSVYAQCVQSGLVAAGHNAQRDKWNKRRETIQQLLTT